MTPLEIVLLPQLVALTLLAASWLADKLVEATE